MYNNQSSILDRGSVLILQNATRHPLRWLLPIVALGGLGLAYAMVYRPDWQASQALSIREESSDAAQWSGRFNEAEQLKHVQETVLELAKSPPVITAALRKIGPPADHSAPQNWPTPQDVAAVRDKIGVTSPNGTEFGTTRLFYLNVADPDPQRAIQLVAAVCDEAEKRFKKLREQEAKESITELSNTAQLAEKELETKTAKLRDMETSAGSDLAELRMLSESFSGGSNLQTTLAEVRQELRQVETTYQTNQQLLSLLVAAQHDPSNLVATPNRLLDAQPALRRLKDGLIDAQLASSQLLGTMSPDHPRVKAALVAESEIRGHLHRELEVAVRGLTAEQTLDQTQLSTLTQKADDLQRRMEKLAGMRAAYSNQLVEVRQQTESVARAQQDLNAVRAGLASDQVISLMTRVDSPETGPYPAGPGRTMIATAGLAGGLLVGFGLLLLTTPMTPPAKAQVPTAGDQHNELAAPPLTTTPTRAEPTQASPQPIPLPATLPPAPAQPIGAPVEPTLPDLFPAGRTLTLKEALMRFTQNANVWN